MELTTRAVALRRADWREADALATLYTERLGRVRVRAIGARHLTSKFAPWLEPGAESEVRLHSRGRSWPVLTGIRPLRSFPGLRNSGAGASRIAGAFSPGTSLARFAAACEVLELVDLLFPAEEPHPEAYHLLTTTLEDLEAADHTTRTPYELPGDDPGLVVRRGDLQVAQYLEVRVLRFTAALLTVLGYGPIPDLAVRDRAPVGQKVTAVRAALEQALAPHLPRARRAARFLDRPGFQPGPLSAA